jgi:hypothetical protein
VPRQLVLLVARKIVDFDIEMAHPVSPLMMMQLLPGSQNNELPLESRLDCHLTLVSSFHVQVARRLVLLAAPKVVSFDIETAQPVSPLLMVQLLPGSQNKELPLERRLDCHLTSVSSFHVQVPWQLVFLLPSAPNVVAFDIEARCLIHESSESIFVSEIRRPL